MDLETCSWCADEVEDSSLTDTDNGRICNYCVFEAGGDDFV